MAYTCSACSQQVEGDVVTFKEHTDRHIIELIKHDHPNWVESDGICQKCVDYYRGEIQGSIFKDAPCALRLRKVRGIGAWVKSLFK